MQGLLKPGLQIYMLILPVHSFLPEQPQSWSKFKEWDHRLHHLMRGVLTHIAKDLDKELGGELGPFSQEEQLCFSSLVK